MLSAFAADLILNGYSPRTAGNYGEMAGRFLRFSGQSPPAITAEGVKAYLRHLIAVPKRNGQPRSASTVLSYLKAIRTFCRWAVANNLMPVDVTVGIRGPRPKDRIIDPCQAQDVIALLQEARRSGRAPVYSLRNHALLVLELPSQRAWTTRARRSLLIRFIMTILCLSA